MLEILEGKEKIAQLMWLGDEKVQRIFGDESERKLQIQVNNKFFVPVSRNTFCSCAYQLQAVYQSNPSTWTNSDGWAG